MQLRLFNDAGFKIYVNVNGTNFMVKRNRFIVVPCSDNQPVRIKLMIKYKSFVLPSIDEVLMPEATVAFNVISTYVLNLQGGMEHQFSIKCQSFSADKYVEYCRLYIDEPLLKNNCTYEITNLKKACKRAKRYNFYTLYLIVGVILTALHFYKPESEDGVQYFGLIVIGVGLTIWGLIGRIRIRKKLKNLTNLDYIQACFRGYVEEDKSL